MDREIAAALLRLIILLPLICGLAYLAIRFGFGRAKYSFNGGKKRHMQVMEQLSLGPKCGLSLVQVGEKYMLFAHQESSIVLVMEMDELPTEVEAVLPEWHGLLQYVKNKRLSR